MMPAEPGKMGRPAVVFAIGWPQVLSQVRPRSGLVAKSMSWVWRTGAMSKMKKGGEGGAYVFGAVWPCLDGDVFAGVVHVVAVCPARYTIARIKMMYVVKDKTSRRGRRLQLRTHQVVTKFPL